MSRPIAMAWTVTCLAALTACSDGLAPQNVTCPDDGACPPGQICAFGICVDPNDQRLSTVDIEIDPGRDLPVQTVFGVDLKASPRVDVALAGGVVVSGAVQTEADTAVDAFVVAQPPRSVPGRVVAPTTSTESDGSFTLLMTEGLDYLLSVSPSSQELPPVHGLEVEADGGGDGTQALEPITLAAGTVTLTGVVVAGEGASRQRIDDLDVRVVDAEGRRVSSLARTQDGGAFVVVMRERLDDLELRISSTLTNPGYPTLSIPLDLQGFTAPSDLGEISLGAVLSPVPFVARIVDDAGAAVPRAIVTLAGALGAGTYTASLEADDNGVVDEFVPPGTYEATVLAPVTSAGGGFLVVDALTVPASNQDLVLTLPPRVTFSGTVLDPDGVALEGAALTLGRVGDVDGVPEAFLADSQVAFVTTSDATGQFSVSLDPGTYRLTTRPPPGRNAPGNSEIIIVDDNGVRRNVVLPDRAFVAGTVSFAGAPVGGAYLRIFSALVDERGAAIPVGEGATAGDGAFEIVVPDTVSSVATPDPP